MKPAVQIASVDQPLPDALQDKTRVKLTVKRRYNRHTHVSGRTVVCICKSPLDVAHFRLSLLASFPGRRPSDVSVISFGYETCLKEDARTPILCSVDCLSTCGLAGL